jgi:PilZ domain
MTHGQERRRDPRTVTSVMSGVYVGSGRMGHLRYLGPAIVIDISESGLALQMDLSPERHNLLYVKNYYFEVEAEIRSITPVEAGVRIGCQFRSELQWKPEGRVLSTMLGK